MAAHTSSRQMVFVALIVWCLAFVSASAASFHSQQKTIRRSDMYEQEVMLECSRGQGKELKNADCETQTNATIAHANVRPIFLKFHKVGGTTIMNIINGVLGINMGCGRSCGVCHCLDEQPRACTGHASLDIIQEAVRKTDAPGAAVPAPSRSLRGLGLGQTELLPHDERLAMLRKVERHADMMQWLPNETEASVVLLTLLRDPVERIRSKYYFNRARENCKLPDCIEKNISFTAWLQQEGRSKREACCEYVDILGNGDVEKAKMTLATLFDVIGITESMDEMMVDVSRSLGAKQSMWTTPDTCRSNDENKEPWTEWQHYLAKNITAEDIEIYNFAAKLSKSRMIQSWGSEEALSDAVRAFNELNQRA